MAGEGREVVLLYMMQWSCLAITSSREMRRSVTLGKALAPGVTLAISPPTLIKIVVSARDVVLRITKAGSAALVNRSVGNQNHDYYEGAHTWN